MDGEYIMENPYEQMDDLGGKPIIFGETPIFTYSTWLIFLGKWYIYLHFTIHKNQPFMQVNIPVPWTVWACFFPCFSFAGST